MRKNGLSIVEILVVLAILIMIANIVVIAKHADPKPEKEVMAVMATEESYGWGYPFPSTEEFGESDSYSMVWIGESSWIWKRFLLVKAKENHRDYGRLPFLLKAIPDVERKGYTIVSKEFLSISRDFGHIDSLLLEIRPPENTKNTEKRNP